MNQPASFYSVTSSQSNKSSQNGTSGYLPPLALAVAETTVLHFPEYNKDSMGISIGLTRSFIQRLRAKEKPLGCQAKWMDKTEKSLSLQHYQPHHSQSYPSESYAAPCIHSDYDIYTGK